MKKKTILDYFTMHPNTINSLGVIAAVIAVIITANEPMALFGLFILPLLQSQQVVPPEELEDDSTPMGFTADIE